MSAGRWKRKHVLLPLGIRIQRRIFYGILVATPFLLVAIALILLLFGPQVTNDPSEPAQRKKETTLPVEEVEEKISLASILEKYRAVSGLQEVNSVLISGRYVEDSRRFEMILASKAPAFVSKSLQDNNTEIVLSFDGAKAIITVEENGGKSVTKKLEHGIYRSAFLLEGLSLGLAGTSGSEVRVNHALEANQVYEGRECWTVLSQLPGCPTMTHLIDCVSGYERARYLTMIENGQSLQISLHFSGHRKSGQYLLPHRYKLVVNGVTRGQAFIQSIQVNSGIMPWMFSSRP